MSEQQQNQSPVINLKLPGEFGAEEIQQVKVDHNRLSPAAEQALGWAAMLRLPADGYEAFNKPTIVALSGALFGSLAVQLIAAPELLIPIGVVLLMLAIVIWAAALKYKSLRVNMLLYLLLFLLGAGLGIRHVILGAL